MKEKGEAPVRKDVAEYVARLPSITTKNPNQIALHGTSWDAITYMLKTGYLRGTGKDGLHIGGREGSMYLPSREGDLSFFALPGHFLYMPNAQEFSNLDDTISDAEVFARNITAQHGFLRRLGIPLDDHGAYAEVIDAFDYMEGDKDHLLDQLPHLRRYASVKTIMEAYSQREEEEKGVLLSFGHGIEDQQIYDIIPGDAFQGDLRIRPKDRRGTSYLVVTGIEPLGKSEEQKLEALRAQFGEK